MQCSKMSNECIRIELEVSVFSNPKNHCKKRGGGMCSTSVYHQRVTVKVTRVNGWPIYRNASRPFLHFFLLCVNPDHHSITHYTYDTSHVVIFQCYRGLPKKFAHKKLPKNLTKPFYTDYSVLYTVMGSLDTMK